MSCRFGLLLAPTPPHLPRKAHAFAPRGVRYEWAETTFALPPNKCRTALFVGGRLCIVQAGHSALKGAAVPAADLAAGRAVLDIFQLAALDVIEVG